MTNGQPSSVSPAPVTSASPVAPVPRPAARPEVSGKFFALGGEKLYLRGVTYGPFRPGPDGVPYRPDAVEDDFARIRGAGINTVRLYTLPPRWLLDAAGRHGLLVMAGLAWEQHVAFLEERKRIDDIVERVRGEVAEVAGHPALLAWAIGNEIPAPIVRWSGPGRIASFLERLHAAAKSEDPGALVTYVNYPTTEYLELDFLDFVCFNVFLEDPGPFHAYLARLQNLAGERPLVLTEIGLDSGTNGEEVQARTIDWQVRAAFAGGSAGAFVFSWTDEWHRGGADIEDWHFGVTDRARRPKPALEALRGAFAAAPLVPEPGAPRISVVVCTHNGSRTLEETCQAVQALEYPRVEAILVDDGSTDASAEIAGANGFRVISTPNRGLSSARNTGLEAATGEIIAYIDDDAAPDPHWLTYLAHTFAQTACVAAGGPNLAVPGDGLVADAVAAAPGNPNHVLISDREAEHIPGCNSAFRADALRAIGGFDPGFQVAGDDVDVCWRLQESGYTISYSPAAMVWHHRRSDLRAYLRQQRGYGKAESMLERKWPERYSAGGHVTWRGRLYGPGAARHATGPLRWRVYHGTWGTAPFQSLYEPARGDMNAVLLMPEAYLGIGFASLLVALGFLWPPLFALAPAVALVAGVLAVRATVAAARAKFPTPGLGPAALAQRRVLTALLHLIQPLVRLDGRMRNGLTPWRRRVAAGHTLPVTRRFEHWSEEWGDPHERLRGYESELVSEGAVVRRGSSFDAWDLEVRGGTLAGVRVWSATEEHGEGQLTRLRARATWSRWALALTALLLALGVAAALSDAYAAAAVLGALGAALGLRTLSEASAAMHVTVRTLAPEGDSAKLGP